MPDLQEVIEDLSSKRTSRSRKYGKKQLQGHSQMFQQTPNKKLTLIKEIMDRRLKRVSQGDKESKADKNLKIYFSSMQNSRKRKIKKETKLHISKHDRFKNNKITTENGGLGIKESSNDTIIANNTNISVENKNKFYIPGYSCDETMNVLFRNEDDKVDDNCYQDTVGDLERASLEKDECIHNDTCTSDEKPMLEPTLYCCQDKVKDDSNTNVKSDKKPLFTLLKILVSIYINRYRVSESDNKSKNSSILILKNDSDSRPPLRLVNNEENNIKQNLEAIKDVISNEVVHSKDNVEHETKQFEAEGKVGVGKDLMKLMLSEAHFKIKTDISVYILDTKWHPKSVGDIPWGWLNEEKWRLHTYSQYPHSANKSAILLAEAGFAYLGSDQRINDRVICHFCLVIKQDWQSSDVISVVHRDLSPHCSMVTGVDCNNVPMTAPECGPSIFCQLNKSKEILAHSVSRIKAGQEVDRVGIETDAPDVIGQSTNQGMPNLPGNTTGTAHVAKPLQMASQTFMRADSSSSISHGQSAQMTSIPTQPSSTNVQQLTVPTATNSSSTTVSAQVSETTSSSLQNTPTVLEPTATNNSTISSNTTQSLNPPQGQGMSPQTAAGEAQNTPRSGRGPTYGELGIITERPKRFEYAVRAKRFESFEPWPRDHHIKKEDLADSGFYYAGYGDCARCFYCGGGLRNWEDNDNVSIEHARWFPKCAFIRQSMGQQFVDAVQDLNRDNDKITFAMVTQKMGSSAATFQLDTKNVPLKRDPAVITILGMGYTEKDVFEAANFVKESCGVLSADKLFEKLQQDGKPRDQREIPADSQTIRSTTDISKDEIVMNQLKEQNNQLRQQTVCKICMDKEVSVVFLPCGHLVSCTDCAAALKDCPVCRNPVRGIVRAFMA